jgi:hypothetical protein
LNPIGVEAERSNRWDECPGIAFFPTDHLFCSRKKFVRSQRLQEKVGGTLGIGVPKSIQIIIVGDDDEGNVEEVRLKRRFKQGEKDAFAVWEKVAQKKIRLFIALCCGLDQCRD